MEVWPGPPRRLALRDLGDRQQGRRRRSAPSGSTTAALRASRARMTFVADVARIARRASAERRAHRRAQPRARWSRSWAPRHRSPRGPSRWRSPTARSVIDARTNEQFDEAHIPGAISASAYDTGFATKVARIVARRRRADRRRGLRRLRAGGGRAARLGRPAGCADSSKGGMTAWRSEERPVAAPRADRPRCPRASGSSAGERASSSSTSATGRVRQPPHPRARSTSPTAS